MFHLITFVALTSGLTGEKKLNIVLILSIFEARKVFREMVFKKSNATDY